MSRQKENTMKRITFAWVLALAAAVWRSSCEETPAPRWSAAR